MPQLLCCSKNDDAIIFFISGTNENFKTRPKRSVSILKGLLALAAKLSQDKKNQRRHALKNILKYFFRENRMSITSTTEEKKDFTKYADRSYIYTSRGSRFAWHIVVDFQKHVILTFPVPIYFNQVFTICCN